jgi:hypothetical protein
MRAAFLILPLAASAAAAPPPGDRPSRATMEQLLHDSDNFCSFLSFRLPGDRCDEVPRRLLKRLHCIADPRPGLPSRILCSYAGVRLLPGGGRVHPFGPECVYVRRFDSGLWRIDSYPDTSVCEQ